MPWLIGIVGIVAQKLAQEAYLKGKLNNVDDDKLELIRLFIADVQELKAATMPTIPMSQGTPSCSRSFAKLPEFDAASSLSCFIDLYSFSSFSKGSY